LLNRKNAFSANRTLENRESRSFHKQQGDCSANRWPTIIILWVLILVIANNRPQLPINNKYNNAYFLEVQEKFAIFKLLKNKKTC